MRGIGQQRVEFGPRRRRRWWFWGGLGLVAAYLGASHSAAVAEGLALVAAAAVMSAAGCFAMLLLDVFRDPPYCRVWLSIIFGCLAFAMVVALGIVRCDQGGWDRTVRQVHPVVVSLDWYADDHGRPAPDLAALMPDYVADLPPEIVRYETSNGHWRLTVRDDDYVMWGGCDRTFDSRSGQWTVTSWSDDGPPPGG